MENLEQAFDKAVAGQATPEAPQGQAPEAPSETVNQPVGQAETTQEAPKESAPEEGKTEREWDGKAETLSKELKQDPKAIQRAYTRISMAKAEAEKKLREYEGLDKQEIDAYRQWKTEQARLQQQQTVAQPPLPTQLSPEQMEMIKNDPNLFTQYVQSLVNSQLNQAAQVVGQELQEIKHAQSVAEWERTIADFGEVHPDMWEMHQAGLFKPILEETIKAGGTLEDAYNKSATIRDAFRMKATEEAQARVKEKKNAATFAGTSTSESETIRVDNAQEAFDKAFDLAYNGKHQKVKVKSKK